MTKGWGHSKCASLRKEGEGRLKKKVTQNYVGGGFSAKKCNATHSKKTIFCE